MKKEIPHNFQRLSLIRSVINRIWLASGGSPQTVPVHHNQLRMWIGRHRSTCISSHISIDQPGKSSQENPRKNGNFSQTKDFQSRPSPRIWKSLCSILPCNITGLENFGVNCNDVKSCRHGAQCILRPSAGLCGTILVVPSILCI